MKKLKRYSVSIDSETYAISLVDAPAIEENWVFLSKDKPLFLRKEDKHLVVGAVLIPDKPIYRRFEDDEFEVVFSKETIEKMAYEFLSKRRTNEITLDHEDDAFGVSVVESWIIASKNDKAVDYGFDLPIGTWMVAMKVNDEETWNRVKNKELNGFSVESLVSLDEYNFNKTENKEMISEMFDEEGLLAKIKQIINEALGKSEDEPQEEVVEEAATEVIEEVHNEENSEDKIDASEEEPVVEETPEEIAEEVVETVVEDATSEEEVKEDLQAVIDSLNAKIDELNVEVEELRKENKKLGSQPTAEPVKMHSEKQNPMDVVRALREGTYFQK
mgnify:CR=1 FL=1